LTALRKEPQRRYASVERFCEDITRHLNGLPVTARKDTLGYRAGKFVGRNKAGVAVAVLAALALITSTIVSVYWAQAAAAQKEMALRLLSFMIGDFDAAMQSGVTSARKVSADKALEAIQQLAPNAANDRSLRKLLIQAYLNVGDLQDNLYGPNLGDAAGARQSYEKALELAQSALRSNPGNRSYQTQVALAERRLGDLAASRGDWKTALEQYHRTREVFERVLRADPQQAQTLRDLKELWYKIGFAHYSLGDLPQKLQSYQRELKLAEQMSASRPGDPEALRDVAMGEEHVGTALAQSGSALEGLERLGRALALYQSLLRANPGSIQLKHDISVISVVRADVLRSAGRLAEAEEHFRAGLRMLGSLAKDDPHNEQYQRDTNAALCRLADVLLERGNKAEARQVTERAIASLEPLASKPQPSAYDIHQYCWVLLTTPFRDLHNPPVALAFAQKAVDLTRGSDPAVLDLLARAYEDNSDFAKAVETERQVLALLPRAQTGKTISSERAEFENNLKKFEDELARATTPAARHP
jgi:eukaryotic-like serine/threonine-protein kinase